MGIVISLILIAFGAILTWAVTASGGTVDPQVVGVVLMVIGLLVFAISLVLWHSWWGPGFWAGGYGDGAPVARRRAYRPYARRRTTTYVEDDPAPPPEP